MKINSKEIIYNKINQKVKNFIKEIIKIHNIIIIKMIRQIHYDKI